MISGYSQVERYHAIAGAIERVKKMKTEVRNGDRCSLFRDTKTILKCKQDKQDWSNTWYLKGNIKSTEFCPITPGGVLRKEVNKTVNINKEEGNKVLVIEDGGRPIQRPT